MDCHASAQGRIAASVAERERPLRPRSTARPAAASLHILSGPGVLSLPCEGSDSQSHPLDGGKSSTSAAARFSAPARRQSYRKTVETAYRRDLWHSCAVP